ncbi:MAG TPA: DUF1385 domain-containing protein [Thermoleophilaceae bacterium]|nr:DUF1385 domain-containing protein [Thermoleophilaceae bacterium]
MTAPVPEEKLRLGGMALRNGLLVHGPTHWAAAVRDDSGEIKVASGRKPNLGGKAAENVPGVRGVVKLAEAIAVIPLVKRALPEARLPMQDVKTLSAMGAAALGGTAIRSAGVRKAKGAAGAGSTGTAASAGPGSEAAVALLSLAPALMALRSGDLAAYHGVEHKSIAAYEDDGEAADATKEHDRCGSHLVAPMLAAAAVGNVAARRAGLRGPAAEAAVGLGSAAVAVEVFAWGERHPKSRFTRLLRRPGHEIQRVVGTREPTSKQLEVGRAALEEILRVEDTPA